MSLLSSGRSFFEKIRQEGVSWVLLLTLAWILGLSLLAVGAPQMNGSNQIYVAGAGPRALANFDGIHYLNIAQRGYVDEGRFLPVYPLIVAGVGQVLGGNFFVAGVVVSVVSLLGASWLLGELWPSKLDQKPSWLKVLATMLALPTGFFWVSVYSESLFLLLVLLSWYLAKKGQWRWSVIVAGVVSVSRLVGVAVLPALIWEWAVQSGVVRFDQKSRKCQVNFGKIEVGRVRELLAIGLAGLPLLGYAWFNLQKWGSWTYFISAHTDLGNSRTFGLVNPLRTVFRYLKIGLELQINQVGWWIAMLEVASLGVVVLGLGYFAWKLFKTDKNWLDSSGYVVQAGLLLLVPLVSGTLSGLPRYGLVMFPILWVLLSFPKKWWWGTVLAGILIQICLWMLFSQGVFVA